MLRFENGKTWYGEAFGHSGSCVAECVFCTAQTGYTEAMTDPSYLNQILIFSYPLIGNYGVTEKHAESSCVVTGVIVSRLPTEPSHYTSQFSLVEWCRMKKIIGLVVTDTRALVKCIRDHGTQMATLSHHALTSPKCVSSPYPIFEPYQYNQTGSKLIVCIDCGVKKSILDRLSENGLIVQVIPRGYPLEKLNYDGIVISNGPGDPHDYAETILTLQNIITTQTKPILGICLGHQLLTIANGGTVIKMKFGHRGLNHSVRDIQTNRTYITSQNHGYCVSQLPENWQPWFENILDGTNEGMFHVSKPFYSVQFHPEGKPGPSDTDWIFSMFAQGVCGLLVECLKPVPPRTLRKYTKILLLGSGGLMIGQAGEFDYSGSQCIKALQEEGIQVVLVNPNIASTQSSLADKTYYDPILPEYVDRIIADEKPDGVLIQFGGQTALNCGLGLKSNIPLLGTSRQVIECTEDREWFVEKLREINEPYAPSFTIRSMEEARERAKELGYPVLLRNGFSLGGQGSAFITCEAELARQTHFPLRMDKGYVNWKELEYEVLRDYDDNCIVVCNMENIDPLGIHTGDSIVVTPSQTLTNDEYFMLRKSAIKIIRHLNIIGECNIQFGVFQDQYIVIEVNARLSRSSALASKATGYPLAYVAAKVCIGQSLLQITNKVTRKSALFEPALDYCVVKVPRWDLQKFNCVSTKLGSAMKSVGEAMAIGRSFEEAFQNALRGTGQAIEHLELSQRLLHNKDINEVASQTGVDKWFLHRLQTILYPEKCANHVLDGIMRAKQLGFTHEEIERHNNWTVDSIQKCFPQLLQPVMKQIDTCSGEFECFTNYLYPTWCGQESDVIKQTEKKRGAIILGCGPYRIGSSCEFDWTTVRTLRTLRSMGWHTVSINNNPETVSTDYDECDRLYLADLHIETVLSIWQVERFPIIVSMGGQIPNNLAGTLLNHHIPILGTPATSIQQTEDRLRFSQMLDSMHIDQPEWALSNYEDALEFVKKVQFPVLIRPSYVLGGADMKILWTKQQLYSYPWTQTKSDYVLTKFIENAKEIEYDAIADHGDILHYAISEHVEHAGTHSGDATLVLPAQKLYIKTMRRISEIATQLAQRLDITGPFNIQFLCKHNDIKIIECNLRASRSLPFCSKTFNVDFVKLAIEAMVDEHPKRIASNVFETRCIGVKVPVFSFTRLPGADPLCGVDMRSTGEVACFDTTMEQAFFKAMIAAGYRPPRPGGNIFITIGPLEDKCALLRYVRLLSQQNYRLFGTEGTCKFYHDLGLHIVEKISSGKHPNIIDFFTSQDGFDLVFQVPNHNEESMDGYLIRRTTIDHNITLLSDVQLIQLYISSLCGCEP